MTTKTQPVYFVFLVLILISCASPSHIRSSNKSYVPDEMTAVRIAEAIWHPVYGDKIFEEKPFVVTSKSGIWIVQGTITTDVGGALYIEIRKKDCKILKMYHGK